MKIVIIAFGILVFVVWLLNRVQRARQEALRSSGILPRPGLGTQGDVERLVAMGKKIEAIKVYREIHHVGLKEAKEAVEEMMRKRPR